MIEELLPSQVTCVATRDDDASAPLFPEEAAQLGKAVDSRVREFMTGRSLARQALARLGLPASPILRGPKREPIWPQGVVGSITHCKGYRAAAVARQAQMLTLGIDAEIDDRLPEGVLRQVAVDEERAWLAKAPGGIHWDRLLFSAKESLYKAWFPLTGKWLGFEDAVVSFHPADATFHARLLVPPIEMPGRVLTGFDGRFLVRDGLALTAIAVVRGPWGEG
ncbi:4'-phosphopantetheinyl transferase EntD (siderophore biosynthesis) [Rhizobiales bacterium GAS113]|jgi:4'-phosphopantetheinyl transferase EntD|nr:4'-phosphopantetheinyl transferase EntD (siderophore biosynthesis) [Rhizobiales bacterium GAS113]